MHQDVAIVRLLGVQLGNEIPSFLGLTGFEEYADQSASQEQLLVFRNPCQPFGDYLAGIIDASPSRLRSRDREDRGGAIWKQLL